MRGARPMIQWRWFTVSQLTNIFVLTLKCEFLFFEFVNIWREIVDFPWSNMTDRLWKLVQRVIHLYIHPDRWYVIRGDMSQKLQWSWISKSRSRVKDRLYNEVNLAIARVLETSPIEHNSMSFPYKPMERKKEVACRKKRVIFVAFFSVEESKFSTKKKRRIWGKK